MQLNKQLLSIFFVVVVSTQIECNSGEKKGSALVQRYLNSHTSMTPRQAKRESILSCIDQIQFTLQETKSVKAPTPASIIIKRLEQLNKDAEATIKIVKDANILGENELLIRNYTRWCKARQHKAGLQQ